MVEPVSKMMTPESDEQRERRIAHERALLAEAYADIAAGRVISGEEAERWLEAEIAWATAHDH
ncbi:CopG family transcriptional regulator [Brevundimonas sp. SL130]|uniref:CopG family transcriptional regulator n=1 Tax=Brevundimonas sp. SL130 TaxID=2995143 RepID=UPI00226CA456|nr:CopG family transcriptional regulator [Brevundimonas sp. SL130]WAC60775.1 CopG family transcriptional regulator [Brevundimonas sp. SL130]